LGPVDVGRLLEDRRAHGRWRALARAVTLVENARPWEIGIPPAVRPVHCIGVTGPPGTGKSTLVGRLIEAYADSGRRIGVVAIDPSSPFSGGAVLGDRVRMEQHLQRDGVFVRSVASRGSVGALAASARNIVRLFEASGAFDVVVVETVGAGQTELSIAGLADTVAVVTVPGLGDAVQALKAGLLEVADIIVVNMGDRPGAAETMRHFRLVFGSEVPVFTTVATEGAGIAELIAELDRRWQALEHEGELRDRRRDRELADATTIAVEWVRACAANGIASSPTSAETVGAILRKASERWRS